MTPEPNEAVGLAPLLPSCEECGCPGDLPCSCADTV